MRVSSRGYIDVIKQSLTRPAEMLEQTQVRLSLGRRLLELSDDPLGASRVVRGHATLSELESRAKVVAEGKALLGAADQALGDMATSLRKCRDLALRAATPYLGDSEREAIAEEIRVTISRLIALGNEQVHGTYIFAGSYNNVMPFEETTSGAFPVRYRLRRLSGPR